MLRTKRLWIGLGLALCCLLLAAILASPHGQVGAAPATSTPTNTIPSGVPGIPVTPSAGTGSTAQFTIADVQAYLQNHPFAGGKVVQGATAKVTSIQFMSSAQASALMRGEETGLPATATVCYVKIQGPFVLMMPAPPNSQPPTVAYVVEIFDGQTGNLLMWWAPSA